MRPLAHMHSRLRSVLFRLETERPFDEVRRHQSQPMTDGQRPVGVWMACAFTLSATVILIAGGLDRPLDARYAVPLVLGIVVLSRIELALASGFAVPTQLLFVAMPFLLPPASVPLLVGVALVLGRAIDVALGRIHAQRILLGLCDGWFSVGPALVFVAAGVHGVHAGDWPWWILALASQLSLDAAMSCTHEWLRAGRWPRLHVREFGVVWMVDTALAPIGLLCAAVAADTPVALLTVLPLAGIIGLLAQERRYRLEQAVELSSAYQGVSLLLGEVIEDDDHYTGEHSRGVVALSVEIAQELGMSERDQRLVEFGALLHDVGKLRVPNEIINKPGPLDDAEWAIMRRHTIDGEAMLAPVGGMMHEVGRIVRGSHEDWDGTGYPDGLAGEQIPLAARIVSCADAYSAMTTDRSYRKALGHDNAVAELRRCAGTQFDPRVVEAAIVVVGRTAAPPPEALVLARAAVAAAAA